MCIRDSTDPWPSGAAAVPLRLIDPPRGESWVRSRATVAVAANGPVAPELRYNRPEVASAGAGISAGARTGSSAGVAARAKFNADSKYGSGSGAGSGSITTIPEVTVAGADDLAAEAGAAGAATSSKRSRSCDGTAWLYSPFSGLTAANRTSDSTPAGPHPSDPWSRAPYDGPS